VLAPLLLIAANPTPATLLIGAGLAVAGLAIRAWASGYLKKNQELTTSGPYAYTRNPLYLGTFILGAGVAICSGALWFVALFVLLYLVIYVPVMSAEAETMRKLFPQEYEDYSRHVPLFLPRLTPYRPSADARRFEPALYLRHREYRAAFGFIVVFALLAAKLLLTVWRV
jgi:protein-S-isoprenylcysteine O-methyltransferase Ste14